MDKPKGYFTAGDVVPIGECGFYVAHIDHKDTLQGGTDKVWWERINVLGATMEDAIELRKWMLKRLNKGNEHVQEPA